jgi:extracellular elastinolytic metalloproteinase
LSDYPAMPITPLVGFPPDWIGQNQTIGNSTRATLNFTAQTLTGTDENGMVVFNPSDATGDDQKLLNIFYFCNYMHDFLFILGFDELAGNFQLVNSTQLGLGHDPVRARAHSGPVNGTANMATGPDGLPPLMNMGLVASTGRHTAFDADVVFHEYTHGLTNRLVGGPMDTNALVKLQSAGMGEGWSDYFALTIQNFLRTQEKVVAGDWVVQSPEGIRRAPYDDSFPFKYNDLANFPINPNTGVQDEHDIGEVWCAALMMMTRRIRHALGNDQTGYRLAWRMVVDGLKLMQANPTFLDARDAILRALDDLKAVGGVSLAIHKIVRKASWEAFAHFGMGVNAFSDDADSLDGITADFTLPAEL